MRKTSARPSSPLRDLRRARALNQDQLAALVGITQQSLSKIEKGLLKPSAGVQALLATILGTSRHDLFPETPDPIPTPEQVTS